MATRGRAPQSAFPRPACQCPAGDLGREGRRRHQALGGWAGQNQRRLAARMLPRSKARGPNSWLCGPGINHTYLLSPLAISNLEIRFPAFKNSPVWGSSLPLLAIFVNKFFMLSQKRWPLNFHQKARLVLPWELCQIPVLPS